MDERQRALNAEGRDLWDQKAAFWDELHGGEGNLFHRRLDSPAVPACHGRTVAQCFLRFYMLR